MHRKAGTTWHGATNRTVLARRPLTSPSCLMPLRVVVLGQIPTALATQLPALLSDMDLSLVAEATDTRSAQGALMPTAATLTPDIAIVSASLTDGSTFTLLRGVPSAQRPAAMVVIGTRDDEAVSAFELQATDFVLWPTDLSRLEDALTRARQVVLQRALLRTADELQRLIGEASAIGAMDLTPRPGTPADSEGRRRRSFGGAATGTLVASAPWRGAARVDGRPVRTPGATDEAVLDLSREDGGRAGHATPPLRVLVREGRRTRFVPLAEVDWFEADGNYIRVHATGETYRTRGTITAIESALDPRQFVRIHRRIVVNMDRVREMSPLPGGDGLLVLGDGSTLRLSRTYRSRVR